MILLDHCSEGSGQSHCRQLLFQMCSGTSSPTSVTHFIDLDRPSEEVFSRDLSDFPSLENGTGTNDEDELSLGLPTELKRKKQQLDSAHRPSKERQSAAGLSLPPVRPCNRPLNWRLHIQPKTQRL